MTEFRPIIVVISINVKELAYLKWIFKLALKKNSTLCYT